MVGDYIASIKNIPIMTAEEEKKYGQELKKGSKEARDKFVTSNLRLVISIAKKIAPKSRLSFDDLVQEGNLGLMRAAEKFDPDRGYKFSTYAHSWIKNSMLKATIAKTRNIHVPDYIMNDIFKINKATSALKTKLNREPSLRELSEHLKMDEGKITYYKEIAATTIISLDAPVKEDDETSFGEIIPDENFVNFEEELEKKDRLDFIYEILDSLSEREKLVIIMRYGLDDERPKTLNEIGVALNLTKERIRQIESKALNKLRNPVRLNKIKEYM